MKTKNGTLVRKNEEIIGGVEHTSFMYAFKKGRGKSHKKFVKNTTRRNDSY